MNVYTPLDNIREAAAKVARRMADTGRGVGPCVLPAALSREQVSAYCDGVQSVTGKRPTVTRHDAERAFGDQYYPDPVETGRPL